MSKAGIQSNRGDGYLFSRSTYTGKAMRAVAQDRRTAALMSINVGWIDFLTFGLGAGCAGIAGALLLPLFPVYPTVGLNLVIVAFVVVILGGLGSLWGALFLSRPHISSAACKFAHSSL
jgi:branched-chain amino acid transport system permease protein